MRLLTADFIFSAHTGFIPGGILVLGDDGSVNDLLDPLTAAALPAAERFSGVLCPGFINAHCHLELSHLRGQITKHTGFAGFAKELLPKRGTFSPEEIAGAIAHAEEELFRNGIVGVGDISNNADSFPQKLNHRLRYHTFIELLGLDPEVADIVMKNGMALRDVCPQTASLAPHAPYSVSDELVRKISQAEKNRGPLAMHNQESRAESEFFEKGSGSVCSLYEFLGMDISFFKPTGKNSLRSRLGSFDTSTDLLLVHNTFSSAEDIAWAQQLHPKLWWCFCPNANLYIENTLPDFSTFDKAGARIVVGTDSLASNDGLSILEELKVIAAHAPEISLEKLLTWATKNGADALHFNDLGTFETGKKPGVIQLTNLEPGNAAPSPQNSDLRTQNSLRMGAATQVARVV